MWLRVAWSTIRVASPRAVAAAFGLRSMMAATVAPSWSMTSCCASSSGSARGRGRDGLGRDIELATGLTGNETVVLSPPDGLTEDDRVETIDRTPPASR